jgi:hypothetical protein
MGKMIEAIADQVQKKPDPGVWITEIGQGVKPKNNTNWGGKSISPRFRPDQKPRRPEGLANRYRFG